MKKSFFMLSIGALALGLAFGYLNLQNTTTFAQDDTEAAAEAAEAPAEDAKAADAKEAQAADAKEAPAEEAQAADAKEAPAEDAQAADAKEAPAEDAKAADGKEVPAEEAKAADGEEAPAEEAKIDLDQQRAEAQAILSKEGESAGDTATVTINNVKYTFHWCPAGSFMMGSPKEEQGHTYIERQHEVKLTKGFWMLETEVTQEMYRTVMPELKNPSYFADSGFGRDLLMNENGDVRNTDKFPVDRISFEAAQQFCQVFSGLAGVYAHLPTEAQWEYACRAGTTTTYYSGDTLKRAFANYHIEPKTDKEKANDKNLHRTNEVGSYSPNPWGLRDMMGNLNEWCSDWYDPNYYMAGLKNAAGAQKKASDDEEEEEIKEDDVVIPPVTDPQGPDKGQGHILRGGSWYSQPFYCRSAARNYLIGNFHYGHYYDGFRFICIPNEEAPASEAAANEGEEKAEDAKPAENPEEKAEDANANADKDAEADKAGEDAGADAKAEEATEDAGAEKAEEAVAEVEAAEDADASAKEAEGAEANAADTEAPDDKAEEEAVKEDAAEDAEE